MLWPMFFLALAFCGIAVLGVLAVRVGLEVRRFARAVGDGSERIARAAEELERSVVPLSARAGAAHTARGGESTGGREDLADGGHRGA
jgi:hypothetical protein